MHISLGHLDKRKEDKVSSFLIPTFSHAVLANWKKYSIFKNECEGMNEMSH